MKNLIHAGKFLLWDMTSTLVFLAIFLLTQSLMAGVVLGIALGLAQIAWERWHRRPIDTMQWVSLVLVVSSGTATVITHDPRFMMLKLTVIYAVIGGVMLKRGWMDRYMPPIALEVVPDVGHFFGYAWAGLMFLSAALNVAVALHFSVAVWAAFMSAWAMSSKLAMFLITFATMRIIGARRRRRAAAGRSEEGLLFREKEAKKLLTPLSRIPSSLHPTGSKNFLVLFSKKGLLALPVPTLNTAPWTSRSRKRYPPSCTH